MKLLFIIIISTFFFNYSYSGNLQFNTETPIAEQNLKIRYTPTDSIYSNSVNLVAYCFNNSSTIPTAYEVELKKDVFNTFIGEFIVPQEAIYSIFKIENIDNNFGNYWNLLVYDVNKKPVKNSPLYAALSFMGNNPEGYSINTNFSKAMELLEIELKHYPNDIQSRIALLVLKYDTKKITYSEFENSLIKILKINYEISSEGIAKSLSRAYRVLNNTKEATRVEFEFARKFPQSELAQESLLVELSAATEFEKFSRLAIEFIQNYPNSNSKNRVLSALVNGYLQMNKFDELSKIIDSLNLHYPSLYSALALEMRQNKKVLSKLSDSIRIEESIAIMDNALQIINDSSFYYNNKPINQTKKEFYNLKKLEAATIYETLSELYRSKDKTKAIEFLEESLIRYSTSASKDIYIKLIDYYNEDKQYSNILALTESAILNSYTDSIFLKTHKETYYKLMPSESDSIYNSIINNLLRKGKLALKERLKSTEVKVNSPSIVLNNINSGFFDSDDIKNKVTVIFFWSSWCEPCKAAMPAYEELSDYYDKADSVQIISVNVWENFENKPDGILKFVNSFGMYFDVFYDINDLAGAKFNLTGLPGFIFIDKNRQIRFFDKGFTNDVDFIEDALTKIDYLLEN